MTRASNRPLLVAILALVAWRGSLDVFSGRGQLHEQSSVALYGLFGNEAIFYVAAAVAQSFVIGGLGLWLARRWEWGKLDDLGAFFFSKPRQTLVALSLAGGLAAFVIALAVVHQHATSEDEKTYLFQAKLLLMGRLWAEIPPVASPLWEPFVVRVGTHWSGQYFWAQSALLALGLLAHAVYAVPALEVACAVLFTGLLAEELSGDRRAGLLAAAITAASPIVLLTGATLLNATLSASCAAASLWGIARLHRGPSRAATWALGLSTAVAMHNRVFDHVALILGATCVLAVAHARSPLPILRRLVPAVLITLPFVALHPIFNRIVSGDWRHSGYWLYYQANQGLIMLGFGPGMGGFHNDVPIAIAKTLANAVRMAFYTAGSPFVFAPLAVYALVGTDRGALRAAGWMAAVYYGAYLLYASAPIQTTGPVYFDALVPLLAAAAAVGATRLHDAVGAHAQLRRMVPALVVAQMVAAFAIFWPPALTELRTAANDSGACDDLVAATLDPNERALVFVAAGNAHRSWTYWKPMPSPTLDDRVLFANIDGPEADTALAQRYGDRHVYYSRCVAEPHPRLERFDPHTGRTSPLLAK